MATKLIGQAVSLSFSFFLSLFVSTSVMAILCISFPDICVLLKTTLDRKKSKIYPALYQRLPNIGKLMLSLIV